ncbi:MAG: cyclic nucleotide-binding domain-containing protein [Desulforhabdus sp.]|jgi:CRP-like cAMP-binding protein|nr:cyclic nucleotide-binding domain-containing protein [Desulforhabdus sp.]
MVSTRELRELDFFKDFQESELAALASIASLTRWNEGEAIFHAGTPATYLYTLKSGTILLCFPNGRSLPLREEGHALGWSSLVSPFRYTATALCLSDVRLYRFSGRELYRLIQMDAAFGQRLMHKIARVMEQRRLYRQGKSVRQE